MLGRQRPFSPSVPAEAGCLFTVAAGVHVFISGESLHCFLVGWCTNKSYVIATSDLWLFIHASNLLSLYSPPRSSTYVNEQTKRVSKKLYQLSKFTHFLNAHARKLLFNAHIQSVIDYASTLWDPVSATTLKPLASINKHALKLSLLKSKFLTAHDCKVLDVFPPSAPHAKKKNRDCDSPADS